MKQFDAVLFDMDGVLYNGETPIPGASEALAQLHDRGIPHLFVTNTTSRSRAVLGEKLHAFGIPAESDQILTPCIAAREYMRGPGAAALFVPAKSHVDFQDRALLDEASETGARWVVVGDLGTAWTFATLNRAFRLLQSSPDAELIALGLTKFWQAEDGLRLDTAPFVAALECATGRKAVVMGKPAPAFFDAAIARLGVSANRVLMVGDDVQIDVGGAQQAGLKGALVKTGKFRPANLQGAIRADFVIDSIVDVPALL
jgi:phospholysine phosphohistidine inorganic pyrophosphate phosphatase